MDSVFKVFQFVLICVASSLLTVVIFGIIRYILIPAILGYVKVGEILIRNLIEEYMNIDNK